VTPFGVTCDPPAPMHCRGSKASLTALWLAALAAGVAAISWAAPARADEDATHRQMTQEEIEHWLSSEQKPGQADIGETEEEEEAPPLPPRPHGFVVESSVGALGHLGPLKNISPISPWFHLQFGFEPLEWLMAFAEGDLIFSNTSYAHPPPEPRAYVFYGFGGGLRLTVKPTDRFGIYVQGDIGAARIDEDVLFAYGYQKADRLGLYFGGDLGLEWYQVSRHYAIALHGGVRDYQAVLGRTLSNQQALAWTGGLSLRYVF
jgi:hypothetical protein